MQVISHKNDWYNLPLLKLYYRWSPQFTHRETFYCLIISSLKVCTRFVSKWRK